MRSVLNTATYAQKAPVEGATVLRHSSSVSTAINSPALIALSPANSVISKCVQIVSSHADSARSQYANDAEMNAHFVLIRSVTAAQRNSIVTNARFARKPSASLAPKSSENAKDAESLLARTATPCAKSAKISSALTVILHVITAGTQPVLLAFMNVFAIKFSFVKSACLMLSQLDNICVSLGLIDRLNLLELRPDLMRSCLGISKQNFI